MFNLDDISPKTTFILYLSFGFTNANAMITHTFFYLGDGKIITWDNQSSRLPSELLLEYHNETGALLNVIRKNLSSYTQQYPISKIITNTSKSQGIKHYFLFASDGLEPYYEDFLRLIQKKPEFWTIIQQEKCEQLQDLLISELFEGLKVIPNDDLSFIILMYSQNSRS